MTRPSKSKSAPVRAQAAAENMLIDSHSHLDRYDEGMLESALEEITQHSIFTVANSMDLPSYRRSVEISERCDLILPTFGVHPWNAPEYAHRLEDLSEAIELSPMLGEIGLDFHFVKDASNYPAQQEVFEHFLSAARDQNKIISLHTKGAEEEILRLLDRYDTRRVIVHWYSGPLDVFQELIGRGTTFTIGVEVLFSEHIQTIARELPAQLLLTETDNPGGPKEYTGTLGMPILLRDVIKTLAKVRKTTAEAIIRTVHANFLQLIRDDRRLVDTYAKLSGEVRSGT